MAPTEPRQPSSPPAPHPWVARINALRPGETVRVKRFDREGRIGYVHLHKQLVKVAVGALELEVPLTDLDL